VTETLLANGGIVSDAFMASSATHVGWSADRAVTELYSVHYRALVRLERMGLPLGPVLATPCGRAYFFVAPGAAAELPQLLYRMGWDDAALDLHCLGPGDFVTAPPSDLGGLGPARWLRPPEFGSAAQPPEARLLLGTLAYACHRDRTPGPWQPSPAGRG